MQVRIRKPSVSGESLEIKMVSPPSLRGSSAQLDSEEVTELRARNTPSPPTQTETTSQVVEVEESQGCLTKTRIKTEGFFVSSFMFCMVTFSREFLKIFS